MVRSLLILFGIFAALLAAEGVLRLLPTLAGPADDSRRSYIEAPHKRQGRDVVVRDREMWPVHPEGTGENQEDGRQTSAATLTRILAVGDSFTYGYLLKNSGSWPKLLERELRAQGHSVSVLNGGRPGSNTTNQLSLFNRAQLELRPDIVLLGFLINDCTRVCSNCGPVGVKRSIRKLIKNPKGLAQYSLLYRNLTVAIKRQRMTNQTIEMYLTPYETEAESYRSCINALTEFKELSTQEGFTFAVVIYPMLFELSEGRHPFFEAHRKIIAHLDAIGVPVIDLTDAFFGEKESALWVHPGDSHPNRRANEIAAKRLVRFVAPLLERRVAEAPLMRSSPRSGPGPSDTLG